METETRKDLIIQKLEELVEFYGKCLNNYASLSISHPHFGASEEDIKTGERLRKEIAKLEAKIIKEENNG